ncbi:hypothetical protein LVJ85_05735 [Neisseria sp. Dent CA1/247]|uniref:hypothetical protein n=1 Tax=Neisseria sp. Dent CA1/247 TaxID=2912675 RepID=UPI001FD4C888|nr:hypothetical protein [Neisseria sp. Dent CA1/247]UOO77963.1 hypothetical protein LVJ85_05735 [Neisseria sp. Dent CA1/247]
MIENNKIELEIEVLKALLITAGKDDLRWYINSIAIKDGFLVSTDSHRAARWKFPTESESFKQLEIIMPRKAVEAAISFFKSSGRKSENKLYLTHNHENHECSFQYTDKNGEVIASTNFLREGCKYVDVTKVFNEVNTDESKSEPAMLNPDYLADLAKMQKELGIKRRRVKLITNGIKATYAKFHTLFGAFEVLIMPCGNK